MDDKTMEELIFRCLRCDHIAYEIDDEIYYCPECGFSWEVIK